ncbi:hemin uptake protein HemP [Neptunomonas antarctica]|uniref:Hemin uptake protein hemP n=1 Tax=Neptunomonas antarctica TaxID=619304 RepID=A0A1N7LG19_9GAMM|nr:hemin uptake protein HemP [Neptunomonas antarctica]SIS72770.1 Hemin uptake protein hemP [Neptunomonas antarctica]
MEQADALQPRVGVIDLRQISSQELLNNKKELLIVHNGQLYHLRETRNGKLILTK